MNFNRVKLGRAVAFMNYLASKDSLIFLPKSLIWNKIRFRLLNSLNLAELVVNELMKSISRNIYQSSFFYLIYHNLLQRFSELITNERYIFSKILVSITFY